MFNNQCRSRFVSDSMSLSRKCIKQIFSRGVGVNMGEPGSSGTAEEFLIKRDVLRSEGTLCLAQSQRSRYWLNSLHVWFAIRHLIWTVTLGLTLKRFSKWVNIVRLYLPGGGDWGRRGTEKNCVHYNKRNRLYLVFILLWSVPSGQTEKADRAFSLLPRQCRSLSINMLRRIDFF